MVTPLCHGGEELDRQAVEGLVEFYSNSGIEGVLALGTTGEGILMRAEERRLFAEMVLASPTSLRVIVHCGAQTTAETQSLAAHAAESGADAVAVIGPPYFALTPEELVAHFAAAGAACAPLPFYLYEFADRTGYEVPLSVVQELRARVPNLAGMKVSDSPFERVQPYLGTGLDVFVGAEALIPQALEGGAVGAVSGVAAAFPEAVSALVRDPTAGRAAMVKSLRVALSEHTFQASLKQALFFRGAPVQPVVRAPLRPLHGEAIAKLRAELGRLVGEGLFSPSIPAETAERLTPT